MDTDKQHVYVVYIDNAIAGIYKNHYTARKDNKGKDIEIKEFILI